LATLCLSHHGPSLVVTALPSWSSAQTHVELVLTSARRRMYKF